MLMSLVLALFAAFGAAHAKTLSETEYWQRTSFPQSLLTQFISNEKCESSAEYLASCRQALNAARWAAGLEGPAEDTHDFESAIAAYEKIAADRMPVQWFRARIVTAHLNFFDAHAGLQPTALLNANYSGASRNLIGVGIVIENQNGRLIVRETVPGSPAQLKGLKEDDEIVEIAKSGREFEKVVGNMNKASDLILDKENTKISFRILRNGRKLEIPMQRARVSMPYVSTRLQDGIGYVRIFSFESQSICGLVRDQLTALNAEKIILDLRGNPGGDKAMAVCVAELFLGPRKVLGTRGVSRSVPSLAKLLTDEQTDDEGTTLSWEGGYVSRARFTSPMVVLVDGQSASGSEIVAGALQDHGRAWIVGDVTSGKGTIQHEDFLPGFPSLTLKYTTQRFYQPSGRTNQAVGITPSFRMGRRQGEVPAPVLRETDLFPKSLEAENPPWSETRPLEAARISACINSSQGSVQYLANLIERGESPDFQLASAQAVLNCM